MGLHCLLVHLRNHCPVCSFRSQNALELRLFAYLHPVRILSGELGMLVHSSDQRKIHRVYGSYHDPGYHCCCYLLCHVYQIRFHCEMGDCCGPSVCNVIYGDLLYFLVLEVFVHSVLYHWSSDIWNLFDY